MRILKRPLSKKEKKVLKERLKGMPWAQFDVKDKVEEAKVKFDNKEHIIYFVNDKPSFWKKDELYLPLLCGQDVPGPAVVVDEGAVPYITKGADVMRPGIVEFVGDFKKGGVVLVRSVKLKFPIAVGLALYDKEEMEQMEKGKVVKNLHHLGDRLFELCKK